MSSSQSTQTSLSSRNGLNDSPFQIAIAGNPNCGKTTLFNALTGLRYKVANYPGVTVEKKLGKFRLSDDLLVNLVDLPGIYSLSGTSLDEKIATSVLLGQVKDEAIPDCILVVLDSSNLERNLYLATQLLDYNIPLLLALNMTDLAEQKGIRVYGELLSRQLDVPVVSLVANRGLGIEMLKTELIKIRQNSKKSSQAFAWLKQAPLFREVAQELGNEMSAEAVSASHSGTEQTVLSRNLLLGSQLLSGALPCESKHLSQRLQQAREKLHGAGIDALTFEATTRYNYISEIVDKCSAQSEQPASSFGERCDAFLTHRFWGSLVFVLIMYLIFQSIFLWAQIPMDFIDSSIAWIGSEAGKYFNDGLLKSLLIDGILAGVGNVVLFIPQIAILFFFLGLLEDSGYLSRAAFLMDKVMRPFGLQGRSFIPLLSSFACAIPGILSARTIPSWSDRLATIIAAPFMSCSARLPVYTVLISAFIPRTFLFGFISVQGLVLLGMYLLGVFGAALMTWVLKLTALKGKPALFVMEMPPIRLPLLKIVLREVADRVSTFMKSAGTIILACSIVLWFLASFPKAPDDFTGNKVQFSYAGRIGTALEPLIKPLGYDWEIGVGIIASFAAREVFVSSLATVYNLEDNDGNSDSLIQTLKSKNESGEFSTLSGVSLMIFYVFACQCMSTLAVCRRETGSWGWTFFIFVSMTLLAYLSSLATYQLGAKFFG